MCAQRPTHLYSQTYTPNHARTIENAVERGARGIFRVTYSNSAMSTSTLQVLVATLAIAFTTLASSIRYLCTFAPITVNRRMALSYCQLSAALTRLECFFQGRNAAPLCTCEKSVDHSGSGARNLCIKIALKQKTVALK